MTPTQVRCPRCGSDCSVPISYGLPTIETEERAIRGELVLGGCVVNEGQPDTACRACGQWWRSPVERGA